MKVKGGILILPDGKGMETEEGEERKRKGESEVGRKGNEADHHGCDAWAKDAFVLRLESFTKPPPVIERRLPVCKALATTQPTSPRLRSTKFEYGDQSTYRQGM